MLNPEQHSNPFASKPKSSFLPFLTVLFLVSYGLLTMLVVEQGRTIDAQRYLISQLFSDSTELTSLKGKVFRKQYAEDQARLKAQGHGQAPAAQPQAPGQAARPQNPSTQTPSSQAPSSQVTQQEQGSTRQNPGKLRKQARPEKPPKISVDSSDIRRNSLVI